MVVYSPDIRVGASPRVGKRGGALESQRATRLRMWVAAETRVLGSYIPPASFERAGAVLHVHIVGSADVEAVRAVISAGSTRRTHPMLRSRWQGTTTCL